MNDTTDIKRSITEEKAVLDLKITALAEYIDTPTFEALDMQERHRLLRQVNVMMVYSEILGDRLTALDVKG